MPLFSQATPERQCPPDEHLAQLEHLVDVAGYAQGLTRLAATVRDAADGDQQAFSVLVATFHLDMVRVAFVVAGGDQDLADEAVQSAWAVAWRRLRTVRDPERVKAWLLKVAANEARQLVRRRSRRWVVEISPAIIDPVAPDPAGLVDDIDLRTAFRHLAPDDRALLALRYVAGLDASEIAAVSGTTGAAIRGRLARAIGRLRTELSDDRT